MADWSYYTTHGWSLFPIHPHGKTPAIESWEPYQTIPAAPPLVARWSTRPDYNTGVATGAVSRIIVLDLDGMDAWAAALARGLPETLTVKTPRGWHYYFQHPGWRVSNRAGPRWCGGQFGWDIRGDGGYVVGPGSYYTPTDAERAAGKLAGAYAVETDAPIAPAPDWLLALLAAKPVPDTPPVPLRVAEQTSAYGRAALHAELAIIADAVRGHVNDQINASVFAIAQLTAGGEITEDEARGAITEALAARGIVSEDKTLGTVERAWSAGFDHPRAAPPAPGPLEQFGTRESDVTGDRELVPPAPTLATTYGPVARVAGVAGSVIPMYFQGCTYVASENSIFIPAGVFLSQSQFDAVYGGPKFALGSEGDQPTKSAWDCFTRNEPYAMPKAHASCFRPECPAGAILDIEGLPHLNTYVPIRVPRVQGDASPFVNHVRRMLPVGRDADLLLYWMASCVQNPGRKFQWWPVIQGTKGNGKSLLLGCMFAAVGARYSHLVNPEAMQKTGNQFNDWVTGKLFVGFEEIRTGEGQHHFIEMLKDTVTNGRQATEAKGKGQRVSDNRLNGMMLTNWQDAVPVDDDERRWAIFWCAQQSVEDLKRDGMGGDYFPDLYDWLNAGGTAIVAEYLHTLAVPAEMNPARSLHRAPETSSTPAARSVSRTNVELEILEAVSENRYGFRGGFISSDGLRSIMERLKIGRTKWGTIMRRLGYDYHPGVTEGRVSSPLADGSRPRLYVRDGYGIDLTLTGLAVGQAFDAAQACSEAPASNVVPFKR